MNQPCPPFSPCWCTTHPTHPNCQGNTQVPINNGIVFLLALGLIVGILKIKNKI